MLALSLLWGCPRRPPVVPPAEPAAPAPRARVEPSAASAFEDDVEDALAQVDAAIGALEAGEAERAGALLGAALEDLDRVHAWLPGGSLLAALDDALAGIARPGASARVNALLERARSQPALVDPPVLQLLERTMLLLEGDAPRAAAATLRSAREHLASDLGASSLTQARARTRESAAAVERGDLKTARARMTAVPFLLRRVESIAPLVPIRRELHAAAAAAERGRWDDARRLLSSAVRHLDQLRPPAESPLTAEVERLEARVRDVLRGFDRRPPRPSTLWDLAARARTLDTG